MAIVARRIIEIDVDKCNGCGVCVDACHEGAIRMVDGKARLVSDSYCDGLGGCLEPCPTGALSLVTRPATPYDEESVARRMVGKGSTDGCPDAAVQTLNPATEPPPCGRVDLMGKSLKDRNGPECVDKDLQMLARPELMNWPVQLKLIPSNAPYLKGANLLLAADCAAVAAHNFHARYLKGRPVMITCPILENNEPKIAKLAAILECARPASLTVLRMEMPCCGGLMRIAQEAVRRAGLNLNVEISKVFVSEKVAFCGTDSSNNDQQPPLGGL